MQNAHLSDKLKAALDMWVGLTGVDPNQRSFTIRMGGGMDDYTVSTMHRALEEALQVDPTGITTYLLLDAVSTMYLQERSFSMVELLEEPERTAEYLLKAKQFRELARDPEITDIGNAFALSMRQALRHYHADSTEVMKVLENRHKMAYLRRDAFRSIEKLRVDQFLRGEHEPDEAAPAYNQSVHQFWNINSLVDTACRQPSGVTLNLVRDPDDFQSYFAFAIRNGGNLFILSDVPEYSHPMQRFMSRRPDRAFSSRASRNWFPYDLMNLKVDEENERIYADTKKRVNLIPLQQEVDKLKRINELEPEEILWIVMMFDLIVERFWDKKFQAKELSYTGAMVVEETPLIESAQRANLPVTTYQTLNAPHLTTSMLSDDESKEAYGKDGGSPNKWMEERYADRVTDDALNIVDTPEKLRYLPPLKGGRHDPKNHEDAVVSEGGIVCVDAEADKKLPFWNKEGRYSIEEFDATSFGTAKEIENNRRFIARHNQAKVIQRLADEEYAERKEEVMAWWSKAIQRNSDQLLNMAAQPDGCWVKVDKERWPNAQIYGRFRTDRNERQMVCCYTNKEWRDQLMGLSCGVALHQGYRHRDDTFLCYLNGTSSSFTILFQPQTADELALLAGCKNEDMPDVLQHWCADSDNHGNQILSRIDPMSWVPRNPWEKMQFNVVMRLSKRGLKRIQKERGNLEGK